MRLLVYGGNLYDERRRIGTWPSSISVVLLQERYGLSERKPAFGVGYTDASPYLIFRRILPHGDRAYPITVLLDPGEAVWRDYEWNGAHLLHALFVEENAPGARLLHEAEKFHSQQDIENLFQELGRRELPEAEVAADEEKIWLWWFSSLSSPKSVIAVPDGEVVGLNSRPLIPSMARLMTRAVPSLRCGKGWLIGGNQGQVKPFGVHFVFDDGKDVADAAGAAEQIRKALQLGKEQHEAVELAKKYGDAALKDFFNLPLVEWEKQSDYTAQELFSELRLLKSVSQSPVARSGEQAEEMFGELIEHLKLGKGPMYGVICEEALVLARAGNAKLTQKKTEFVLFHAYDNKTSLEPELDERLNDDEAVAFFVNKELYPSEAGELIPKKYRLDVASGLLALADPAAIPALFAREVEALRRQSDALPLKGLAAEAVERSAGSASGLEQLWSQALGDESLRTLLLPALRDPARLAASRGIKELSLGADAPRRAGQPAWLRDYILYGEDSGGRWLAGQNLSHEAVGKFVRLVIEASEPVGGTPQYTKLTTDWLSALAQSELRPQVPVTQKQKLVDRLFQLRVSWLPFNTLLKLFDGDTQVKPQDARKAIAAREREQEHLLNELRELVEFTTSVVGAPYEAPNLTGLVELFGQGCRDEILGLLSTLHPSLQNASARLWLKGWLRFSDTNRGGSGELRGVFQREWVRYLLESDRSPAEDSALSLPVLLADIGAVKLRAVFTALLFGGGPEQDAKYAERLIYFIQLTESIRDAKPALRDSFVGFEEADKREQFMRRHTGAETLALLKKILSPEQYERLEEETVKGREMEIESRSLEARSYLLDTPVGEFSDEFTGFREAAGKSVAEAAVTRTFLGIMSGEKEKEAFLQRFGENKKALALLKKSLPDESHRHELDEMVEEYEYRRLLLRVRECISYGGGDDTGRRSDLMRHLKKMDDDGRRPSLDKDVRDALADLDQWETFKRRFVRKGHSYRSRESDVKWLDAIFDHLKWLTQREVLLAIYQSDKDSFDKMAENIFLEVNNSKKISSQFQRAVVTLLKDESEIATVVKQYLVTERHHNPRHVEAMLRLVPAPPPDTGERETEASPTRGAEEGEKRHWYQEWSVMLPLALLILIVAIVAYKLSTPASAPSVLPEPAPPTSETSPAESSTEPTPETDATPSANETGRRTRVSPEAALRRARPREQRPRRAPNR